MKPRLFTAISALSLLAALLIAVLWVRSYSVADSLQDSTPFVLRGVTSVRGRIGFGMVHFNAPQRVRPGWDEMPLTPASFYEYDDWRYLGFAMHRGISIVPGTTSTALTIPDWAMVALLLILPARWLWNRRRLRLARRQGRCLTCGYDLRATPERCPECGTRC